jgi:hypothetical protein
MIRQLTIARFSLLALAAFPVLATSAPVAAAPAKKHAPPPPVLPKVGDAFDWPQMKNWLLEPSPNDASGKVIVHWFCTAKIQACTDDLARVLTLREGGHAYIVAYISGNQRDAAKLDPIRGSEGVGFGGTSWGPDVTKLMKAYGVAPGPSSIVVGTDGKVAAIYTSGSPDQLDARDAEVTKLIDGLKEFTTTPAGPTTVAPGQKFPLTIKIELASYLAFSTKTPSEFTITGPSDINCDTRSLKGELLKPEGHTLTATVNCSVAGKGVYEARGQIRFGYDSPNGATGIGDDGTTWKFEVK